MDCFLTDLFGLLFILSVRATNHSVLRIPEKTMPRICKMGGSLIPRVCTSGKSVEIFTG